MARNGIDATGMALLIVDLYPNGAGARGRRQAGKGDP